jgi:hypothetical protein
MKSMFDASQASEVKERLHRLQSSSQRQWGTMTAAQAVAHCATGMETALGDIALPRVFIGRLIGWIVKPLALGNEQPMKRNSPTAPGMIVTDDRDLEAERRRLLALVDRFVTAGPAGCTTHPHAFFGRLTPQEWAILMYKHLDHHLRQFGV